jgi:flagellar assembly factor FliW
MPKLMIQGTEISYDEDDVITFPEGLIGLPHLRRMVIVEQSSIEPFMWLVPVEKDAAAFVVADARALFPGYAPSLPADANFRATLDADDSPVMLAIVMIAADWQESTANLRAPLFISAHTKTGAQIVLADNKYTVGEQLPLAMAA